MATPVIEMMREKYQEAHISVLLPKALAPLLEKDPHLNAVIGFTSYRSLYEMMRRERYDLGILLTNSFSSAFLMCLARVKKRIGYLGDGRRLFLTKAVKRPLKKQHLVKTYQELLGGDGSLLPTLYPDEVDKKGSRRVIGIHAGAAYGPAKCWPAERFRALAEALKENYTVLFFGDAASRDAIEEMTKNLGPSVINLAGKTSIRQLMSVMKTCDVCVTNDSGPMHMADALGVPLVALFGSTDPRITGPYRSKDVIWKQVSCSPCFKRVCPIDFRCMTSISVEEVLRRVQSF